MSNSKIYQMTVDLNVLEHLGINLYSNIAAVLTEVVANTWDADAENVTININPDAKVISIQDDGIGMTIEDINNKYLRVGYRRREKNKGNSNQTPKGRLVMGRKGLGKLSLFSIAEIIEVYSIKDGETQGFRMSTEKIKESIKNRENTYSPESIIDPAIDFQRGTKIILKEVKRQRLGQGVTALRKRLSRRFSIIGESNNFSITINGDRITKEDREDLKKVQFLWKFGDNNFHGKSVPYLIRQEKLQNRGEDWPDQWIVQGWIGTALKPKQLDNSDVGNLNSIVVFSRGRLFHENILEKINDGRLYTKYLTGQIEADFLDDDNEPDIATSDRQRIQEDDPRYHQLLKFVEQCLSKVEDNWNQWRGENELKEVQEQFPALTEWFDSLPEDYRKQAKKLITKLGSLPLDHQNDRNLLYKHGILAFERMKLRGSTNTLVENLSNTSKLLEILAGRDALEATYYRDILKSRLKVVNVFQNLIDENVIEQQLQKYLFENLWLLDPSWEAVSSSPRMESKLLEDIEAHDLNQKEALARVDLTYKTYAGKHIIIELKRAGRKLRLIDLQGQGQTYVDKLEKILLEQGITSPNIEVVFVIGKPIDEEKNNPSRLKASMAAISAGSRIVHYESLLKGTKEAYAEYLEITTKLDRIQKIVDQI